MSEQAPPRPSATVVLLRDQLDGLAVLMLQKNQHINFGGSWVFPGGVIEPDDYQHAQQVFDNDSIEDTAKVAAERETLEETGLRIDAKNMHAFAHWVTPTLRPKRYATWFFVANANHIDQDVVIDDGEIVKARWLSIRQVLDDQCNGNIELNGPSYVTLSELLGCEDTQAALDFYRNRDIAHFNPRGILTKEFVLTVYQTDSAYDLVGGDPQHVIDSPAPRHRLYMPKQGPWNYINEN